jgi:hypothetical protein
MKIESVQTRISEQMTPKIMPRIPPTDTPAESENMKSLPID